jgi:hypothetical protein
MVERNLGQNMVYWIGEVVDVNDPHQSGRVKIRVYGRHDDRTNIPDSALPWAQVTQSVTSAAIGRIGTAPVGLVVGSRVTGFWADGNDLQYPLVIGSLGKAGDEITGEMLNGAPAINTNTGSIPQSAQGNPNNPYSSLNDNRVSISEIDSGSANIFSVNNTEGVNIITAVERNMANFGLPTIASVNKNSTEDVLDLKKAVDPLGNASALPCLNNSLISVSSILKFLGNTAKNIISNLVRTAVTAIRNAILKFARKLGLEKIAKVLNGAVNGVKAIQDLMRTLNNITCGINPINQGLFKTADFVMASVIGGLNNVIGAINGPNSIVNTAINIATAPLTIAQKNATGAIDQGIKTLLNSVPEDPAAAVATATSPRPATNTILETPPENYVQQYYTVQNDPYPGYIEWNDPATGLSVYTLRNGQPNFANAQDHTTSATADHFTSVIGNQLLSGRPLTFNTLSQAVTSSLSFTQAFALSRVFGTGAGSANKIAAIAGFIPTIAGGLQSIFQVNNKLAKLGSSTQVCLDVDDFAISQAKLARQAEKLRVGVNRTS